MNSDNSLPSFDFVKSVTKKNDEIQKSTVGVWIWMAIGLSLCLLSVLFSTYLAVVGLVVSLIATSNGRDHFKSSGRKKFSFAMQIVVTFTCLLLLLLSVLISGLSR